MRLGMGGSDAFLFPLSYLGGAQESGEERFERWETLIDSTFVSLVNDKFLFFLVVEIYIYPHIRHMMYSIA